tara:strand:+ start:218 stop:373 length:156 start_codon:yes stop_codon:yes gene_type:complete
MMDTGNAKQLKSGTNAMTIPAMASGYIFFTETSSFKESMDILYSSYFGLVI